MKILMEIKSEKKLYWSKINVESIVIIDDKTSRGRYKITDDMVIENDPPTTVELMKPCAIEDQAQAHGEGRLRR